MIVVPDDTGTGGLAIPQLEPPVPGPLPAEVFGAEFRDANMMVSGLARLRNQFFPPIEGYSSWDEIKEKPEYLEHASKFAGSQSPGETQQIKDRIDRENKDRQIRAASGWMGTVIGLGAGALDPTMLLPGRIAIGVGKAGIPMITRAAESAAAYGAATGAQELALQASQATRESPVASIASATILGAILGPAIGHLRPGEMDVMARGLDRERAEMDAHVLGRPVEPIVPQATAAGAAATDTRVLKPVGAYGLEKVTFGDPTLIILNQPSVAARRGYADVSELSILTQDNLATEAKVINGVEVPARTGQTSSLGGPPLESLYRTQNNSSQVRLRDKLLDLWKDMRFGGEPAPRLARTTDYFRNIAGLKPTGMTFEQFKEAVSDAMMQEDKHSIPQVQAAAEYVRPHFDQWAGRAEASVPGFGKIEPKPGESYFPHRFLTEKIGSKKTQFVDELTELYAGDQAAKYAAQGRIRNYQNSLSGHESDIKTLTGRLEKKQADLAEDEALREEVSRINKFAFERATALREGEFKNVGGVAVPVPGKNIEKARGGAVFETKVRERGNTLADRASAHAHEVEDIEEKLQNAHANAAEMRGKIEGELLRWEGRSAAEAQSALKARTKYEAEREAKRAEGEPKRGRLTQADEAVDRAVKRILASDRERPIEDLRSRAYETTDRILGSPDGRLPYEEAAPQFERGPPSEDLRGSLSHRRLDVSNAFAAKWIERDVEKVVQTHNHTFMPDVLLAERFGDIQMEDVFRRVNDEYNQLIEAAGSEKASRKLENQRKLTNEVLAKTRDRLRGIDGFSSNASQRRMGRLSASVRNVMVPLNMGVSAISSIPDAAGTVFQWGMMSSFRDGWMPFVTSLMTNRQYSREALREAKVMGIAVDTATAQRHHEVAGVTSPYQPGSPVERVLQTAADKMQLVNFLGPWTDIVKTISMTVGATNLYRAAKAATAGKATAKQLTQLNASNIPNTLWEKIVNDYEKHGTRVDGVLLPNTESWSRETRETFESALSRNANINVVTPGLDKNIYMTDPTIAILTQFKSFTAAATTRIMIANLQRSDAQTLQGLVASLALGMVAYKLNAITGGAPTSDRPQDWIKEAMSRANIFGWLEEGNTLAAKASGGKLDLYRAIGADKPLSRQVSQSAVDGLLGPTVGKLHDLTRVTGAMATGNVNAGDIKAVRRMIAGQNLFYLRGLFNQVEAGADNAFGIKIPEPKR